MITYNNIWTIMKDKNISQYKLIYHHGISTSLIDRLKKNKPITTSTLDRLCKILGCEVNDILSYTPNDECINEIEPGEFVASDNSYKCKK